jgi:hydroxymethylglutaryl-CoA lyase
MENKTIHITECPRDAMQGLHDFIPTEKKIAYLNLLLKVGFGRLDFGSFVSPKAIPQLRDTAEVLKNLDWKNSSTELLAIIANTRGAEEASKFEGIKFLGFPFSISETFQQRNTNSSIAASYIRVKEIQEICDATGKQLLVYISMAFGNPYGDEWNGKIAGDYIEKLSQLGIKHFALADTIGISNKENIGELFETISDKFTGLNLGAHLHSTPMESYEKIDAAIEAGCRNFDTAIHGFGGCPMAGDSLTGNISTETLLQYCENKHLTTGLKTEYFEQSLTMANSVFPA